MPRAPARGNPEGEEGQAHYCAVILKLRLIFWLALCTHTTETACLHHFERGTPSGSTFACTAVS